MAEYQEIAMGNALEEARQWARNHGLLDYRIEMTADCAGWEVYNSAKELRFTVIALEPDRAGDLVEPCPF